MAVRSDISYLKWNVKISSRVTFLPLYHPSLLHIVKRGSVVFQDN